MPRYCESVICFRTLKYLRIKYDLSKMHDLEKVFVSSTIDDLKEERKKIKELIEKPPTRYKYVGAEDFGSQPERPKTVSLVELVDCSAYVGILANRYGSILEGDDVSITELEYRKAKEIDIPCLIYFKRELAPGQTKSDYETEDPTATKKLRELKEEIKRDNTISWFTDPSDLAGGVLTDLRHLDERQTIQNTNAWYRLTLKNSDIKGKIIARKETETIVSQLLSFDARYDILLTGVGGVGKSGIILQVIEALTSRGFPFLVFRIDSLPPPTREFGGRLGLCDFPVRILAEAAQDKRCVVILDQLDALSEGSMQQPELESCIDEIIKSVRAHPNMRLLVACKQFDLENDDQLLNLISRNKLTDKIVADSLSQETIVRVMKDNGIHITLSDEQLELFSLPLHLKLLVEGAETTADVLHLTTPTILFEKLWEYKNKTLRKYGCADGTFIAIIDRIIDHFQHSQALFVPTEKLDDFRRCADKMVSENVLIFSGTCYAFFHENFFNYAFARRLIGKSGDDLVNYLVESGQNIFQYSLVQSLLLYERDKYFRDQYLNDVAILLSSPDIRFHLKLAVLATLASLEKPQKEEWRLISTLVHNHGDPLSERAWRVLYHSSSWFELLDSNHVIEKWLESQDDILVDRAVILLSYMQQLHARRVAELLAPYVGISEPWNERLARVAIYADLGADRAFFDIFLKMIDIGSFDNDIRAQSETFWYILDKSVKARPDWGCEAIGGYLNRMLALSVNAGELNPFDYGQSIAAHGSDARQMLVQCAKNAPTRFTGEVLPFMLAVMQRTLQEVDNLLGYDSVWGFRNYGGNYYIKDQILHAMEIAFRRLAVCKPDEFAGLVARLEPYRFNTVYYLIIRGYAANAKRFADESIDYLCADSARLDVGYIEKDHWVTRELLEAISPYGSDIQLIRLENEVLTYYPRFERGIKGFRDNGRAQLILFDGIVPARRSNTTRLRLDVLTKKFGPHALDPPKEIEVEYTRPPISEEEAAVMTNDDWLAAMNRYDSEYTPFSLSNGFTGGALELSRLLETEVRKDPTRFADLASTFPDEVHHSYIDAVLRGISNSDVEIDARAVFKVCEHYHQYAGQPFGRSIPNALANCKDAILPKRIRDIIIYYALNDPDPPKTWDSKAHKSSEEILTIGINSVRGASALAIEKRISYDESRPVRNACYRYFLPAIKQIALDHSAAVRSCAAAILTSMLGNDPKNAFAYFSLLVEIDEDALLNTYYVTQFLNNAITTDLHEIERILERMVSSHVDEVATRGAEYASLAALYVDENHPLVQQCISGTVPQRLGVAAIFSRHLRQAHSKRFCERVLVRLLRDTSEEVRSRSSFCFMSFESEDFLQRTELIHAFINSPAFSANSQTVIYALEQLSDPLPDIAIDICERFLDTAGDDISDFQKSAFAEGITTGELAIRGYKENRTNQTVQRRYGDLIERMLKLRVYGLEEKIKELSEFKRKSEEG